jgi:exonuclease SbcD
MRGQTPAEIYAALEERLGDQVKYWLDEQVDPQLPTILTAHASVQGAKYGGERTVMLGSDLVLPGSLVRDPRLDYVALGHIHKPQNINEGQHPPVIYPGSIERVDFGEAGDDKFYIIANVEKNTTEVEWRQLKSIRPFVDCAISLETPENINEQLRAALPPAEQLDGAIVRLVMTYPREWEAMIDEATLREYTAGAFEFHLIKRPQQENRVRLPDDQNFGALTALELLEIYWQARHTEDSDTQELQTLAAEILQGDELAKTE